MNDVIACKTYPRDFTGPLSNRPLAEQEWLVANGLGGYASATVGWVNTWRYHGILVSAERAPFGRMMMLKQVIEDVVFADGRRFSINENIGDELAKPEAKHLEEFRLEYGLPVWRYRIEDTVFERLLFMPHRQNTTFIIYRVVESSGPVTFELRPYVQMREYDLSNDSDRDLLSYKTLIDGQHFEIGAGGDRPKLRMKIDCPSSRFTSEGGLRRELFFRHDAERGYNPRACSWSPGWFTVTLQAGSEAALAASTEEWPAFEAMNARAAHKAELQRRNELIKHAVPSAREDIAGRLVLAADEFLFEPMTRVGERVCASAKGDEVRAIIAGYHWFTDWGRDTFISLEGLTLMTGRPEEARWILRNYGSYVRDGLVPNMFPEGAEEGLYHTADASLWYFHALGRYLEATNDRETLQYLLPTLIDIAEHHINGTRFNIGIDPEDGLMRQGIDHYQLTWMDAKVEDWVVTPRRGKAVELNGLWYNAVRLLSQWLGEEGRGEEAHYWYEQAEKARASFNRKFWYETGGYLYDVVDAPNGNDTACRPNQLFSFSLAYKILDEDKWPKVLDTVKDKLLSPQGLRTLSPDNPDYKPVYFGDLRARDAAYHQGTIWPWLIGPFIDAHLAAHPEDKQGARAYLQGFYDGIDDACLGSISEINDAEPPFKPRGCISQAWSVAEPLRCWVKTAG